MPSLPMGDMKKGPGHPNNDTKRKRVSLKKGKDALGRHVGSHKGKSSQRRLLLNVSELCQSAE